MNTDNEIISLSAESLAIQAILTVLLRRMPRSEAQTIFKNAINECAILAADRGGLDSPAQITQAAQKIAQLRDAMIPGK